MGPIRAEDADRVMRESERRQRRFRRAGSSPDEAVRAELNREARAHYLRGNRFFDLQAWDQALAEWRRAVGMWQRARQSGRLIARRLLHLRAALALLATVFMVYLGIFAFFPRDSFEMILLSGSAMDNRSWWERFLDTGRPQFGDDHKMGVREWWQRFTRRLGGEKERRTAGRRGGRPPIDKRWEDLLRRYGRWGPYFNFELDYRVISGYGLSRLGDYENAVKVFEKGIEDTHLPDKLADLYQGLANAHYYKGYRLQPDGLARYDLDYVRKSTRAYRKSVDYQPRAVSYGNLGWMYFLQGDYRQAVEFSRRALSIDPMLEYVRLNLGLIYLMEDRIYDAFEAYREFIRHDPGDDVYMGGINDLREVIRDNPGRYPFAHLMVGLLAVKQGEYGMARESLSRFQANPFVGQAWRNLARDLLRDMDARGLER